MEFILNDKVVLKQMESIEAQNEIKLKLTLWNPQYKTLQRLGKWTGGTPEKLKFYDQDKENPDVLTCPRGFAETAYKICLDYKETIDFKDQTRAFPPIDFTFHGSLKPFQKEAVSFLPLKKTHGVLSAGTGSGKTVMALYLIAQRQQPTLIVVHTAELVQQWMSRIETFLHIPVADVGVIGGGKLRIGEKVTVGLYQSIRKNVEMLTPQFGHLVVDECHKCPSKTFTEAVSGFDAKYRLGLTATGFRRDGLGDLIFFTLGDLRYSIEKGPLLESGDLCDAEVRCRNTDFDTDLDASENYPAVIKALTLDEPRNRLICSDVAADDNTGIKLILTDRREHALTLRKMLKQRHGLSSDVLTGTTPKHDRERIVNDLSQGGVSILIATGQLIGEGFDMPRLSTLFLVMPIKFKGRLIQYVGRILRPAEGKSKARIYDYVDLNVGVLEASAKWRLTTYREEGVRVDCPLPE